MRNMFGLTVAVALMITSPMLAPCAIGQDAALPKITPPACEKPPLIDGDLSDACWENSAKTDKFYILGGKGRASTNIVARVIRDNEWLYVSFEISRPRSELIQSIAVDHDGNISADDSVEIFLCPGMAGKFYYQYKLNSANVRVEQKCLIKLDEVDWRGSKDINWDMPWRSATRITKAGWQAEIGIPLIVLAGQGALSEASINLCANEGTDAGGLASGVVDNSREIASWAPVKAGFHEPSNFGKLLGLNEAVIAAPLLVAAQAVKAGISYLTNDQGRSCYEISGSLRSFTDKAGKVKLVADDKPATGKGTSISQDLDINKAGYSPFILKIPVSAFPERTAEISLLDPKSGEILQKIFLRDMALPTTEKKKVSLFRLPKVFSDHMVLQRDCAARVWGWADPGEAISVAIAGQKLSTTADKDGNWQVKLAPLAAECKPLELTVTGKTTNAVIRDILVGDVWLCSGQSNMECGMNSTDNASAVIPTVTNAMIRLLSVKLTEAGLPAGDIPGKWTMCVPHTVGGFSAVGYFFGRRINKETGIPIGLINNACGGSAIEKWMPVDAMGEFPDLANTLMDFNKRMQEYNVQLGKLIDPLSQWAEKARQAQLKGESLPLPPVVPENPAVSGLSGLYNARVMPLIPYSIKGALWYQGEANGGDSDIYVVKMQALIGSWRKAWNQGDFPFYYVQLANYSAPVNNPAGGTGWANARMAQFKSLKIPHTGMAIAIDVGDAKNIHPGNKEDVGERLALWALKNDYGQKNLVCSGPLYKGMTAEGSKIRVSFDYAENGLMAGQKTGHGPATEAKDRTLNQFAVSGSDKVWFWADAVVDGSTVLVSSTNVPAPVAVRYAFSMNPEGCNLYNKEGLPASPFRTDSW